MYSRDRVATGSVTSDGQKKRMKARRRMGEKSCLELHVRAHMRLGLGLAVQCEVALDTHAVPIERTRGAHACNRIDCWFVGADVQTPLTHVCGKWNDKTNTRTQKARRTCTNQPKEKRRKKINRKEAEDTEGTQEEDEREEERNERKEMGNQTRIKVLEETHTHLAHPRTECAHAPSWRRYDAHCCTQHTRGARLPDTQHTQTPPRRRARHTPCTRLLPPATAAAHSVLPEAPC